MFWNEPQIIMIEPFSNDNPILLSYLIANISYCVIRNIYYIAILTKIPNPICFYFKPN